MVGEGQVFEYDPRDETLKPIYDAPNAQRPGQSGQPDGDAARRSPALRDAAGNNFTQGERLVGLTLHGQTFTFAMNNINLAHGLQRCRSRRATIGNPSGRARCYSPDGRWLFVNIQTPGVTFAITGPWGKGPLKSVFQYSSAAFRRTC